MLHAELRPQGPRSELGEPKAQLNAMGQCLKLQEMSQKQLSDVCLGLRDMVGCQGETDMYKSLAEGKSISPL